MNSPEARTPAPDTDIAAIADLHEMVARQRAAFLAKPPATLEERLALLGALANMMVGHRARIHEALRADFGVHPSLAADLIEVLSVAGRAGYVAENLAAWMAPEPRYTDPALFGTGRAYVLPQAKGVVGNIVPWNFPFELGIGPLVEMLAAGNRVVIKPSEHTPACAELMREMVRATFDRDLVDVAVGGMELAREFSRVRWDHLLYTGSPAVGREVAKAAAGQLVPVTLELGGKCPALLTADSVDAESLKLVLGGKAIKSGQMCISVDYCLVPRDRIEEFATLAQEHMRTHMPGYCSSADCTGIVTQRHVERLQGMVDQARTAGADIRVLEQSGEVDPNTRQLPMTLVIDPPKTLAVMQEEIFGPILVVVPYDSLDEAIEYINAGERPLALYVFAKDAAVSAQVLSRTTSGGASVNAVATHGALASLPFGGVGQSGIGRHHGVEGFREFSNMRGVFERGEGDLISAFSPPYGDLANALVEAAYNPGTDA